MSSNLKQKLRTCFKNLLPQCNIKIILNSTNLLSFLFRFKDVIRKDFRVVTAMLPTMTKLSGILT